MDLYQPFANVGFRKSYIRILNVTTRKTDGGCSVVKFIHVMNKSRIIPRVQKQFTPINPSIEHMIQLHLASITHVGLPISYMGCGKEEDTAYLGNHAYA